MLISFVCFFFFNQNTAFDLLISDWSSDVCSSDLGKDQINFDVVDTIILDVLRKNPQVNIILEMWVYPYKEWGDENPDGIVRNEKGERRSEESRVGKEGISTCRSRWSRYH